MKQNVVVACVLTIFIIACQNRKEAVEGTADSALVQQDTLISKPSRFDDSFESKLVLDHYVIDNRDISPDDVQEIDSAAAIIIYPTDEQLRRMENEYGGDFSTIADDNSFYYSNAIGLLDSLKIKTLNAETPYLKLVGDDDQIWFLDIRQEGAPEWNLIFFHPQKKPEIVSVVDLTREKVAKYFEVQ
ncbi:MAG: hypothetical protein ACOYXT_22110 [Bacteroidota bacterium]